MVIEALFMKIGTKVAMAWLVFWNHLAQKGLLVPNPWKMYISAFDEFA